MIRHVPQFFDQVLFIGNIEKNIEEGRCLSSFLQLRETKLVNSFFIPSADADIEIFGSRTDVEPRIQGVNGNPPVFFIEPFEDCPGRPVVVDQQPVTGNEHKPLFYFRKDLFIVYFFYFQNIIFKDGNGAKHGTNQIAHRQHVDPERRHPRQVQPEQCRGEKLSRKKEEIGAVQPKATFYPHQGKEVQAVEKRKISVCHIQDIQWAGRSPAEKIFPVLKYL